MIKIYSINKAYKPFSEHDFISYLKSQNIDYTDSLWKADVLLGPSSHHRRFKIFKKLFFLKKIIIWTNEPRFDHTFNNFETKNQIIMNVYSENVFFNNTHFLASYHYDTKNNLGIDGVNPINEKNKIEFKDKKFCAAIFSYKDPIESCLLKSGKDISLNGLRQDLAVYFYNKGKADILGSNWSKDIKITEESGFESGGLKWWDRKLEVLRHYKFNICLENTSVPYYCTEKIWHSIFAGCLPIYSSDNSAIYETFPKNSFIDVSNFESFESLLDYLENISESEYNQRLELCYAVLEKELKLKKEKKIPELEIIEKFVANIYKLSNKL